MYKKLLLLVCFVLVAGFSSTTRAGTPIDVNNFSFELDVNGDQLYCHTGIDNVLAWQQDGGAYCGIDPYCLGDPCYDPNSLTMVCTPEECYTDNHNGCHCWPATHGIVYCYLQATSFGQPTFLYQNLDMNNSDANAVVAVGRKYILTWDGMSEIYRGTIDSISSVGYIYYGDGGGTHTDLAQKAYLLPTWIGDHNEWEHEWEPNLTCTWVAATEDDPAIGQTLGIKFHSPNPSGSVRAYTTHDRIRFEWVWATDAFNPSPEDDATDVARDVNLAWSPGLWANRHIVYFGTDFDKVDTMNEDVNQGIQDPNTFDPTPSGGQLVLGKTYYWRVVEVNSLFDNPGEGVPDPPWNGDVWSFTVTGHATNPNPYDGQRDVPFVSTTLSWTPGTDSNSHDVYFGTDATAVENATTSSAEWKDNTDTNSYYPGSLLFGRKYYWRIDEVNETAGTFVKGNLWSFTVAMYYPVDDFESYSNYYDLWNVWKDFYTNGTRSEIYLEIDANYAENGNSMKYIYTNGTDPCYAEAHADVCDLGVTKNWTRSGLEVLTLSFLGQKGNALDDMYVALRDGNNVTGKVLYPDVNEVGIEWTGFREWNIELTEFVSANDVNITDIDRIMIGFGDKSPGGTGTVYFDNIRLYPPRCRPEMAFAEGSFDWDPACKVDNSDLALLAERDWLISAIGNVTADPPDANYLVGHWPMDDADAQLQVDDISGNNNHGELNDEDRSPGRSTTKHHDPCCVEGTGSLTFDGYDDYVEIPALDINTNTITLTAWIKRAGSPNIYAGILFSSSAYPEPNDPNAVTYTCGLMMGADTSTWLPNDELAYMWTGYSWEWHTGLFVPPDEWCFTALTIEPDVGTIYLDDGKGLKAARNYETHEKRLWNATVRIGDQMQFGPEADPPRIFKGSIDDARIYSYTLTAAEILSLSLQGSAGSTYLELPNWRTDADGDSTINFKDFGIMADNWLAELKWP